MPPAIHPGTLTIALLSAVMTRERKSDLTKRYYDKYNRLEIIYEAWVLTKCKRIISERGSECY